MSDDYPDDYELNKIRSWDATDLEGFFEFVVSIWNWPEYARRMRPLEKCQIRYKFHTGGWSGNEEIISAMRENWVAWALSFYSEVRGGHYEFRFLRIERGKKV